MLFYSKKELGVGNSRSIHRPEMLLFETNTLKHRGCSVATHLEKCMFLHVSVFCLNFSGSAILQEAFHTQMVVILNQLSFEKLQNQGDNIYYLTAL